MTCAADIYEYDMAHRGGHLPAGTPASETDIKGDGGPVVTVVSLPPAYNPPRHQLNGHKSSVTRGPCFAKLLVNNMVAGAVIGRSGNVISQIEKLSGCTMRLSPPNDYFPNTTDRVVLITGQITDVLSAIKHIMEKLRESAIQTEAESSSDDRPHLHQRSRSFHVADGNDSATSTSSSQSNLQPHHTHTHPPHHPRSPMHMLIHHDASDDAHTIMAPDRGVIGMAVDPKFTLKIVVPKSAVSGLIGKGGATIQQLQSQTKTKIQISNREEGLLERIVHVTGAFSCIKPAVEFVVRHIQSDPNLQNHLQLSYQKSPNTNHSSSGSHHAPQSHPLPPSSKAATPPAAPIVTSGSQVSSHSEGSKTFTGTPFLTSESTGVTDSDGPWVTYQTHTHYKKGGADASPSSYGLVASSAAHGGMGTDQVGVGVGGADGGGCGGAGESGCGSSAGLARARLSGALMKLGAPEPDGTNGEAVDTLRGVFSGQCDIDLPVADSMVGAMIGKGGAHISEIMKVSDTKIQVSQKGVFIPGSLNRRVTISGTVEGVHTAHILLLGKIRENQAEIAKKQIRVIVPETGAGSSGGSGVAHAATTTTTTSHSHLYSQPYPYPPEGASPLQPEASAAVSRSVGVTTSALDLPEQRHMGLPTLHRATIAGSLPMPNPWQHDDRHPPPHQQQHQQQQQSYYAASHPASMAQQSPTPFLPSSSQSLPTGAPLPHTRGDAAMPHHSPLTHAATAGQGDASSGLYLSGGHWATTGNLQHQQQQVTHLAAASGAHDHRAVMPPTHHHPSAIPAAPMPTQQLPKRAATGPFPSPTGAPSPPVSSSALMAGGGGPYPPPPVVSPYTASWQDHGSGGLLPMPPQATQAGGKTPVGAPAAPSGGYHPHAHHGLVHAWPTAAPLAQQQRIR
ncbi:unnamed protein product [Vitrella brassicaformis CCMP3155]|uniref:K Homology domain-containing protein n=2 Tax=Vitrella brassicaformis TaxID=1169539 RepID=A0A0G4EX85_VITBC|nr:unnamed protein product [Vitrella brassicaformis CCMP3155]|eukprot:CEM03291.1 unnamed protein product [Vitrella brassicaformis CCMP3155]